VPTGEGEIPRWFAKAETLSDVRVTNPNNKISSDFIDRRS